MHAVCCVGGVVWCGCVMWVATHMYLWVFGPVECCKQQDTSQVRALHHGCSMPVSVAGLRIPVISVCYSVRLFDRRTDAKLISQIHNAGVPVVNYKRCDSQCETQRHHYRKQTWTLQLFTRGPFTWISRELKLPNLCCSQRAWI